MSATLSGGTGELEPIGLSAGPGVCAGCGAAMAAHAVVCMGCGMDQRSRRKIKTATGNAALSTSERLDRVGFGLALNYLGTIVQVGAVIALVLAGYPWFEWLALIGSLLAGVGTQRCMAVPRASGAGWIIITATSLYGVCASISAFGRVGDVSLPIGVYVVNAVCFWISTYLFIWFLKRVAVFIQEHALVDDAQILLNMFWYIIGGWAVLVGLAFIMPNLSAILMIALAIAMPVMMVGGLIRYAQLLYHLHLGIAGRRRFRDPVAD